MKFHYKFSNLLGSVYNSGTVLFTQDGNNLLSPVGNKIICYDLKNNKSLAYEFESDYNLNQLDLSKQGNLLIASSEKNHIYMFSLLSGTTLHRKEFKLGKQINNVKFSNCGKYYLITLDNRALVYCTPGYVFTKNGQREISPFKIYKVYKDCYDDIICCDWSPKSNLIALGSKDYTVRIVSIHAKFNIKVNIAGHSDVVIACFFANMQDGDLDLYTVSRNGQLFLWKASHNENDLDQLNADNYLTYKKANKFYFTNALKSNRSLVTSVKYHSKTKILVSGFSTGEFLLHDLPDFNLIQSLQLTSTGQIDSLCINSTGDWIALASSIKNSFNLDVESEVTTESKLVVWEWLSETFILKQVGTGDGVTNITETIAYSPDGIYLATGCSNGKIKIWNTLTGFCFVTFGQEHKGPITGLEFVPNKGGNVLISSSLDGTIRAFDLKRYRNFRTLNDEAENPQFSCVTVDSLSGDFIAAGAQNTYEVFIFSLTTGKLLDKLTGHTAPVSCVKFSPNSNVLASCSWDCSVRLWNMFDSAKIHRDVITLSTDCVCLDFRPDGKEICVSTINGQLSFFNVESADMNGAPIEGRKDLGISQNIEAEIAEKDKYFNCLTYTSDGEYVLAAGKSKFICFYNVEEKVLLKKFKMTYNLSMNGFFDYISKRKVAEFGFNIDSIKERTDNDGKLLKPISLPGVRKGDLSERQVNPQIEVFDVKFAPTMRSFVAASTQGVLTYSLDIITNFDPYQLDSSITPQKIKKSVDKQNYLDAIMQSLKLNDLDLVKLALESVPKEEINFIVKALPFNFVERCLTKIAVILESTPHLEFYLIWTKLLLTFHGINLKNSLFSTQLSSILRLLQRNIKNHFDNLDNICSSNKYKLKLLIDLNADLCSMNKSAEKQNDDDNQSDPENFEMNESEEETSTSPIEMESN